MAIYTPLGEDFLLINRFSAREGISELFEFEAELLHEESDSDSTPTDIDPADLLGKAVTIAIDQRDGTIREFTGIVNRLSKGNRDTRFSYYYVTIVPHVWLLTKKSQSRIFQQMSVPDILRVVFTGFEVNWQMQGVDKKRNYCVQYQETDFDFAARLMAEEGIYFYFEHRFGKHMMVVANTPQSHPDTPSKSEIPFFIDVTRANEDFVTSIHSFADNTNINTGKVTMWDHNFQLPAKKLDSQQASIFSYGDNQQLERYDYPGGYARKFDGIDKSGGEQSGELGNVDTSKTSTVSNLMESLDVQVRVIGGSSDCSSLTSGYKFQLTEHPNSALNQQYVITSVTHEAEQNPTYVSDDYVEQPYANSFSCIRHGAGAPPYRPSMGFQKPVIPGVQTAFVVGPGGEEIFTDKYGRVKVQFHWDRDGQVNADSSCWVRVAQSWAGNRWGSMFIPRIGMEVIVHFIDGDPDQPIITGCVYNPQTMPPYTLPDEKTKSGIKSNSSTGGGGFNEFRFEDKKGEEQIFVHGEKDLDVRIKNDAKELILNDRHLKVENDQFEQVSNDKHLKVEGDQNENVGGTVSLKAGSDILQKADNNYAVDAGMAVHVKAGMSMVLEAGSTLTLKVGGNFININSGGIFIKGTMVMINSGGAAGAGSGCSPAAPTAPQEAVDADAGQATAALSALPPPTPANFTALAANMVAASQDGTAFCNT
jgi:type VI secretion system secreted protein VgrG